MPISKDVNAIELIQNHQSCISTVLMIFHFLNPCLNKLELKQLSPYFPFELKAYFKEKNTKSCHKMVVGTVGGIYSNCSIVCHETVNASPDKIFPILRPISDLLIEIDGKIGLVELAKIHDPKLNWTLDLSEFAPKHAYDKDNQQVWLTIKIIHSMQVLIAMVIIL